MCEFCSFNGAPLFDKGGLTIYVDDTEQKGQVPEATGQLVKGLVGIGSWEWPTS